MNYFSQRERMRYMKHSKKYLQYVCKTYIFPFLQKIERALEEKAGLSRSKLGILLLICIVLVGMMRSIGKGGGIFIPVFWIVRGIFGPTGLYASLVLFCSIVGLVYLTSLHFDNVGTKSDSLYDTERNFTKAAEGTHGTAGFMEGKEIGKVYGLHPKDDIESINGFVIGTVPDIVQNHGYAGQVATRDESIMKKNFLSNRNVVVLGSPGTGKSASVMIQNIIESGRRGESVFVTDPKGELCDKCSPIFRELGYDVKVFNLVYPWHSDKWNFMEWLAGLGAEQEKWVTTISSMIIANTSGEHPDEFWSSTADKLLKALMSVLLELASPAPTIEDETLEKFAEQLADLRKQRDACKDIGGKKEWNKKISEVIRQRYGYLSQLKDRIGQKINAVTNVEEKIHLQIMMNQVGKVRRDAVQLQNFRHIEDYEPITVGEAKHHVLNISTCEQLLRLRIFQSLQKKNNGMEKSEITTSFTATPDEYMMYILQNGGDAEEMKQKYQAVSNHHTGKITMTASSFQELPYQEKIHLFLYEFCFRIPQDEQVYQSLSQVFSLCDWSKSLAYSYWASFTESSENVCTSVKGGLDTRLSAFNQTYIRQMVSENEIDLEKPGKSKCAYFCIISDQETSLSYISSLFITIAFATLQAQADANAERRLDVRTMFYLDEFPNIGTLHEYTKKLSTLRSRDIHIIMAAQNYPQLLQRYDENLCLEMFGDCDLMLFLGCGNEDKTPEFISKLMGKMTTSTTAVKETKNRFSPIKDMDIAIQEVQAQRDLMYLNEIRELKQNRLIALTRGQKPIQLDKYMYFQRPDYDWIQRVTEKYPAISGHPLIQDKTIRIDEWGLEEMEEPNQTTHTNKVQKESKPCSYSDSFELHIQKQEKPIKEEQKNPVLYEKPMTETEGLPTWKRGYLGNKGKIPKENPKDI